MKKQLTIKQHKKLQKAGYKGGRKMGNLIEYLYKHTTVIIESPGRDRAFQIWVVNKKYQGLILMDILYSSCMSILREGK